MKQGTKLDGLLAVGQELLEANERALWALRREHGISDDSPDGWRNLALILARQYISGFPHHHEMRRQSLIKVLMGRGKSRPGRKPKWQTDQLALLLDYVNTWMFKNRRKGGPKRTVKEAFKAMKDEFPDSAFRDLKVTSFCNLVSRARRECRRAALINALKGSHRN